MVDINHEFECESARLSGSMLVYAGLHEEIMFVGRTSEGSWVILKKRTDIGGDTDYVQVRGFKPESPEVIEYTRLLETGEIVLKDVRAPGCLVAHLA